jgi:endonuclease YncB( thermonuclease family)
MKTLTKAASVFFAVLLSAYFCVAQQLPAASAPQSAAVVANNVHLVIEGKVLNVHDGDTITVVDQNNKKFHIRLQGIDAPELKQTLGDVSQQNLSRLVLGKQVTIYWTKVDRYRRTVGTILLDGRDMNIEQVKAGLAWHFKKYADEQEPQDRITYAAAEPAGTCGQTWVVGRLKPDCAQ